MTDKTDLLAWLGLKRLREMDFTAARPLGAALGFALVLLALLLVYILLRTILVFAGIASPPAHLDGRALGILAAALLGAPFVVWRTWVAQDQARTANQGLITDRINKAVENLGATRIADNSHQPNIEVRTGALYALERVAQDSPRDHIQIMEILTAYIRENAPADAARTFPLPDWQSLPDDADEPARERHRQWRQTRFGGFYVYSNAWQWAHALPRLRTDIQTALTIIGRRRPAQIALERADTRIREDGYRLDLRQTNLQAADLSNLNLKRAMLGGARLEGAMLDAARLEEANLGGARLEGAYLGAAQLEGTHLFGARLEGTNLEEARLEGALLIGAWLEGAVLVKAWLKGAVLRGMRFEGVDLAGAQLEGADLCGTQMDQSTNLTAANTTRAAVKSVDWQEVALSDDQVQSMFGDASVILPPDIPRPPHWPDHDLGLEAFASEWEKWQQDPGAYAPPPRPEKL